jgi:hypothetical protein
VAWPALASRRRRIALLAAGAALGLGSAALAVRHDRRVTIGSERGGIRTLVGRFVAEIPRANSEGYDHPRRGDREALADAFAEALRGRAAQAGESAARADYQIVQLRWRGRSSHLVLRDARRDPRGWGLFVASPANRSRVIVEVPHPISDAGGSGLLSNYERADTHLRNAPPRSAAPKLRRAGTGAGAAHTRRPDWRGSEPCGAERVAAGLR